MKNQFQSCCDSIAVTPNDQRPNQSVRRPENLVRYIGGFLLICLPLASLSNFAGARDVETLETLENLEITKSFAFSLSGDAWMHEDALPADNYAPVLWGDDTVGALPIIGEDSGSFSSVSFPLLNAIMLNSAPSLVLEGRIADMRRTINDAQGQPGSYAYLEPTLPGEARLFFHGPLSVRLYRGLFRTGRTKISLLTGAGYPQCFVEFGEGKRPLYSFAIPGGVLTDLHMDRFESSGYLDREPLVASVYYARESAPSRLDFSVTTDYVQLSQN